MATAAAKIKMKKKKPDRNSSRYIEKTFIGDSETKNRR
jgi:hypothetical protein